MKSCVLVLTVLAALAFTGCGGGSMSSTTTPPSNTSTYNISVAVTGLASGATLVVQDNLSGTLTFSSNTTQAFTNGYSNGASYSVTISSQPSGETCTLSSNASGTITSNVTVTATCDTVIPPGPFTLSVAVTGLTSGTLEVEDNLNNELAFTGNSTSSFATTYAGGATYSVTVFAQPTGQTCTLSTNASGTITSNVTVTASCTAGSSPTYTLSAAVTGLTANSLVLMDSQGDQLTFTTSASSTQTFLTPYASGASYSISGVQQPTGETCTLGTNFQGTITANTTVDVTCAPTGVLTYSIGGTVSGLTASGLVLQDNLADNLTVSSGATNFTFATFLPSGSPYSVTVFTQPTGETCTPTANTGTVGAANVTSVVITCVAAATYSIGGSISGLTASGLTLTNNGGNSLSVASGATAFTFTTKLSTGSAYDVLVSAQPTGETCTPSANTGTVATSNVTNVVITCVPSTTPTYSIGGTISGLTASGLTLTNNGGNTLTVSSGATAFTFSTKLPTGSAYDVEVATQPTGETCTASANTGTVGTSNVTSVVITCAATPTYSIGGTISGLTASGLKLTNNGGNSLTVTSGATAFTFTTKLPSGSAYDVEVSTQPTGETCTASANTGTVGTSNVTSVVITCAANPTYSIGGTVSGLTASGLTLTNNGGNNLTVASGATAFTFTTKLPSGSAYDVEVATQPTGESCTPSANTGTVGSSNVTSVIITCKPSGSGLTVSVAVSGLSGSVTFQNDQGDTLTFSSDTTQAFSTAYTSGATYTVSVTSQPSAQACIPTYSTATINSDVTIQATCATGATRKLGTISAVSGVSCSGSIKNGTCQQMTVSCPGVPDVFAYVKTNTPTGTSLGTATYNTGTDGNGLYESIFTYGSTAVGNVLDAGFTTVQISWGTPFNTNQPNGWVEGPGGVLATACRYATVTNWIYENIQNSNASVPFCATANSGGAGALAYALSQYGSNKILSMAEVTSGPPTGRLDWGCGGLEGKLPVQCGSSSTLGTSFGDADAPVWDPAYNPSVTPGLCTDAVNGTLPPGGLNFFLGDSVEAAGATYSFPSTYVNLVFGGADDSSAIPIGQDWFNNITSSKAQACVAGGQHSLANTLAGADQIANDLISLCKIQ